jgi:hypothetical protein
MTTRWPSPLHPLQRRLLAEDLVRRRHADDDRRAAAPQRASRIDPNPHQIEAVVFALARLREGGCILADEVGLGKTIEAGLVIAQLLAEGARRVLLVTPKSLVGQWRQELFTLFELELQEAQPRPGGFDGEGLFIINREGAGSQRGHDALEVSAPFELCVIDEAHEVFAGLYKRFGPDGRYDDDSPAARTAGRLRDILVKHDTPVLLLTATPIQNNLAELWGLVQYVDKRGTLLGDLPTFREVFCGTDDRQLAPGQEGELRERLRQVLQRTLRRQAQAFLERPFVDREARLFTYEMSPSERALYDDVTRYLLEASIIAFQGRHRQLLLLGFHRRMASSTAALAASLERVAARLRGMQRGERFEGTREVAELLGDLEDAAPDAEEATEPGHDVGAPAWATPQAISDELQRVEGFVARAQALSGDDGKFRALAQALRFVAERAAQGQDSGKLVLFTESLVTQEHLRAQLLSLGLATDDEVTLFRGTNDSPRARAALERWRAEVPQPEGPTPSVDIAVRLALVHEFKTRSRVFISTEAGAKGLNLQFCSTVVNYDLPWNPQRIEQRIGRCHRYGQRHAVTVINFLARGNEAQALTFDILSQKLELFGTVLDASDQVLHAATGPGDGVLVSALGAELEGELHRIYERARTVEQVAAELRALRDRVGAERARFVETHERTASLIASRLDEDLARVFTRRKAGLPAALAELDEDLATLVTSWLDARRVPWSLEDGVLRAAGDGLPGGLPGGGVAAIGPSKEHTPLHLGHPLVVAAVADARALRPAPTLLVTHAGLAGRRGRLRVVKLGFDGFEQVERLFTVVVLDDGASLPPAEAEALLRGELRDDDTPTPCVDDAVMDDAVAEQRFFLQREVDAVEHQRFERASWQADRFIEDRLLVLRRQRLEAVRAQELAQAHREAAQGAASREAAERAITTTQATIDALEARSARLTEREDETWKHHHAHNQRRRYTPPRSDVLFDVALRFEAPRQKNGA